MAGETGLIDVIEWQAWVDMATGRQLAEIPEGYGSVAELLSRHPYPGDLSPDGNAWVTGLARDAAQAFSPDLMILHFANQSFRAMFGSISGRELAAAFDDVRRQIEAFLEGSDYEPLIIGLGGYRELEGYVDLMGLDGLAIGGGMIGNLAGLYGPSPRDLRRLAGEPRVEYLVSREDFRAEFGGCEEYYRRFPDWLVELEEGWGGRCAGVMARHPDRIGGKDEALPVSTGLGEVERLEDVRPLVERIVGQGRKVAMMLVEGWTVEDFPYTHSACPNRRGWFRYGLKCSLSSVFSGRTPMQSAYPPILRMYMEEDAYPFSVIYDEPPSDLLGRSVDGLSAAVGNRSILPHALYGADITLECYARYVYNYGSMAILQGRGLKPPFTGR